MCRMQLWLRAMLTISGCLLMIAGCVSLYLGRPAATEVLSTEHRQPRRVHDPYRTLYLAADGGVFEVAVREHYWLNPYSMGSPVTRWTNLVDVRFPWFAAACIFLAYPIWRLLKPLRGNQPGFPVAGLPRDKCNATDVPPEH